MNRFVVFWSLVVAALVVLSFTLPKPVFRWVVSGLVAGSCLVMLAGVASWLAGGAKNANPYPKAGAVGPNEPGKNPLED